MSLVKGAIVFCYVNANIVEIIESQVNGYYQVKDMPSGHVFCCHEDGLKPASSKQLQDYIRNRLPIVYERYYELDIIGEKIAIMTVRRINAAVKNAETVCRYPAQYVLEEVIKSLQDRV